MTRSPYRNPLDLSNSVDHEAIKKNGWLDQGCLVVGVEDSRLSWVERQFIENIGVKLYGKRRDN